MPVLSDVRMRSRMPSAECPPTERSVTVAFPPSAWRTAMPVFLSVADRSMPTVRIA